MTSAKRRIVIISAIVLAVLLIAACFSISYAKWEGEGSDNKTTVEGEAGQFYVEYPQYVVKGSGDGADIAIPVLDDGVYYLQVQKAGGKESDYYRMSNNPENSGEKMLTHVFIKKNSVLDMYVGKIKESIKNKKDGAASQFDHPSENTESPATVTADGYYDFYYEYQWRTMYVSYMPASNSGNSSTAVPERDTSKRSCKVIFNDATIVFDETGHDWSVALTKDLNFHIWQQGGVGTAWPGIKFNQEQDNSTNTATLACSYKDINGIIISCPDGRTGDKTYFFNEKFPNGLKANCTYTFDLSWLHNYKEGTTTFPNISVTEKAATGGGSGSGTTVTITPAKPTTTGATDPNVEKELNDDEIVRQAFMYGTDNNDGTFTYKNYVCVSRRNSENSINDNSLCYVVFEIVDASGNRITNNNTEIVSISIDRAQTDSDGNPTGSSVDVSPRLYGIEKVTTLSQINYATKTPDDKKENDNKVDEYYDDGLYCILYFGDNAQQYFAMDISIVTRGDAGNFSIKATASNINHWQRYKDRYGEPYTFYLGGLINDVWSWDPNRTTQFSGTTIDPDKDLSELNSFDDGTKSRYPIIPIDITLTFNITKNSQVKAYMLGKDGFRYDSERDETPPEEVVSYILPREIVMPDGLKQKFIQNGKVYTDDSFFNLIIPETGEYTFRFVGYVSTGIGVQLNTNGGIAGLTGHLYYPGYSNYVVDKLYISTTATETEKMIDVTSSIEKPEVRLETKNIQINGGEITPTPYIVIGGGKYSSVVWGYDLSNETDKTAVDNQIKSKLLESYYFDMQRYQGDYATVINDTSKQVEIFDDGTFEIVCDISSLTVGDVYAVHFVDNGHIVDTDKNFNQTNFPNFEPLSLTSTVLNAVKYETFSKGGDNGKYGFTWDSVAVAVADELVNTAASLEADDSDNVYLVIDGTYNSFTKAEVEAVLATLKGDYRYDPALNSGMAAIDHKFGNDEITYTVTPGGSGGTYTVKIKLDSDVKGTMFFHLDYVNGTKNFECRPSGNTAVTVGELVYTLATVVSSDWGTADWTNGLLVVTISEFTKSCEQADSITIAADAGKAYLMVSGACNGYTADEIKGVIETLDFEPSHGGGAKVTASSDDIIVTVGGGRYTIKYDISNLDLVYDGTNFAGYWVHLKPFGTNANGDLVGTGNAAPVKVAGRTYAFENYSFNWGSGNILTIKVEKTIEAESAAFEVDGNTIYYAATFATENMTLDEIKSKLTRIDMQKASDYSRTVYENGGLIFDTLGADGKITVKVDITGLALDIYVPHYFIDGNHADNAGIDICVDTAIEATKCGIKIYEVKETTLSGFDNWTAHVLHITAVPSYTVTFKYNYDGAPDNGVYGTRTVYENYAIENMPDDPTRDGYKFGGWYKEEACLNKWAETETVSGPTDLHAKWTKLYTVTYSLGEIAGTLSKTTDTVESGGKIAAADKPTVSGVVGHTHNGTWYTVSGTTETTFVFGTTPVTGDITVYARLTGAAYSVDGAFTALTKDTSETVKTTYTGVIDTRTDAAATAVANKPLKIYFNGKAVAELDEPSSRVSQDEQDNTVFTLGYGSNTAKIKGKFTVKAHGTTTANATTDIKFIGGEAAGETKESTAYGYYIVGQFSAWGTYTANMLTNTTVEGILSKTLDFVITDPGHADEYKIVHRYKDGSIDKAVWYTTDGATDGANMSATSTTFYVDDIIVKTMEAGGTSQNPFVTKNDIIRIKMVNEWGGVSDHRLWIDGFNTWTGNALNKTGDAFVEYNGNYYFDIVGNSVTKVCYFFEQGSHWQCDRSKSVFTNTTYGKGKLHTVSGITYVDGYVYDWDYGYKRFTYSVASTSL